MEIMAPDRVGWRSIVGAVKAGTIQEEGKKGTK
jgi:hypothetical protein